MQHFKLLAAAMIALSIVGCAEEPARRQVTIRQSITNAADDRFAVDLSQVSANWIESRTVEHHQWGDEEIIRIDPRHPVKIVVAPLQGEAGK
jgi:hypothetical protein